MPDNTVTRIEKIVLTKPDVEDPNFNTEVWWYDDGHDTIQYGVSTETGHEGDLDVIAVLGAGDAGLGG